MSSDLNRALNIAAHLNFGLAPTTDHPSYHDVNRLLSGYSPEASRTAKRKFRKAWRRLARNGAKEGQHPSAVRAQASEMGLGVRFPDKRQKNARKRLVGLHVVFPEYSRLRQLVSMPMSSA